MPNAGKITLNLGVLAILALLLIIPAQAQTTPLPFWFDLIPTVNDDGTVTYTIDLSTRTGEVIYDIVVTTSLAPGMQVVETATTPPNQVSYNQEQITFRIPVYYGETPGNSFTVALDPAQRLFTTQSTISWQGAQAGSYQAEPLTFDSSRAALNWTAPGTSRVQFGIEATIDGDIITYQIYPKALERSYRIWDVSLNIPLPAGTTFISADASPPFTAGFSGNEIGFGAVELPRQTEFGPLTFKLQRQPGTITVDADLWAQWTNGELSPLPSSSEFIYPDSDFVPPPPPSQEIVKLDISINNAYQPKYIAFDLHNDVPFTDYDLANIALRETSTVLNIDFRTVGVAGNLGRALEYRILIDTDCNPDTGFPIGNDGAEQFVNYNHATGLAYFYNWDAGLLDWDYDFALELGVTRSGQNISVAVPLYLLNKTEFCWLGESRYATTAYNPSPPNDRLTNEPFNNLPRYQTDAGYVSPLGGRIAFSLANTGNFYDTYIVTVPTGNELGSIENARHPAMQNSGARLLVNHDRNSVGRTVVYDFPSGERLTYNFKNIGAVENIYEYDTGGQNGRIVSGEAADAYPFYGPDGQLVFSRPITTAPSLSQLYVQCSVNPPALETDPDCSNLDTNGYLVSSLQPQGVVGGYPLWNANNDIVYRGCLPDGLTGDETCGIFTLDATATPQADNPATPRQLTDHPTDIPADTQGNLITFSTKRDGNWEAYVMDLNGNFVRNLSNETAANDGLPTLSPDGQWIAFVSDRGGEWAMWVTPTAGGTPQRLFSLYDETPWQPGLDAWTQERISWGGPQ